MADESEDTSGDSTDVFSSKFDPLKVFYADDVKLPDSEAPMFDNISKFESFCSKSLKTKVSTFKQLYFNYLNIIICQNCNFNHEINTFRLTWS